MMQSSTFNDGELVLSQEGALFFQVHLKVAFDTKLFHRKVIVQITSQRVIRSIARRSLPWRNWKETISSARRNASHAS